MGIVINFEALKECQADLEVRYNDIAILRYKVDLEDKDEMCPQDEWENIIDACAEYIPTNGVKLLKDLSDNFDMICGYLLALMDINKMPKDIAEYIFESHIKLFGEDE